MINDESSFSSDTVTEVAFPRKENVPRRMECKAYRHMPRNACVTHAFLILEGEMEKANKN